MSINDTSRGKKRDTARHRLEDDLRRMILSRTDRFDEPLTTEMDLAADYFLCRNTVRKVLQQLTDEGLLRRKTGFGTFVVPPDERPAELMKMRRFLLAVPKFPHAAKRNDIYTKRLISGITDYSFLHRMTLEQVDPDDFNVARMADQYRNLKFDGIIYDRPFERHYQAVRELAAAGIPQVTISRKVEDIPALYFDFQDGMRRVCEFLYGIGHRDILFVDMQGPDVFAARQECFRQELRRLGIVSPEQRVFVMGRESDAVLEQKFEGLLDEFSDATALFYSNTLRHTVLPVLERRKVRIPEELSVLSLDDNDFADGPRGMSSLREPVRELGLRAAELLGEWRTRNAVKETLIYIKGELIMRSSCMLPSHLQPIKQRGER